MASSRSGRWWYFGAVLAAALIGAVGACASASSSASGGPHELVGAPAPGESADGNETSESEQRYRRGALWYRIAVSETDLEVAVRLLNPAGRTSFFLPNSKHVPENSTTALAIQGAKGPGGSIPVNQLPDRKRIDVESGDADWVELHYRVDLEAFPQDSPRPHPETSGRTILAYLPSVLVVPSQQVVSGIRDIPVEIHAPKSWKVLASWADQPRRSETDERGVHGFLAPDVRALRDAFFVAGPRIRTHQVRDGGLTVAFQPDIELAGGANTEAEFTSRVARILRAYENRFGEVGKTLVYVQPARRSPAPDVRGTAKRGGFVIRLPRRRPLRDAVHLLVAHEAFHLWNGHRLVPEPENEAQTRWFKEGVTHYVALKTLRNLGYFDLEDVRRELGKSAFFYRRNPAARGARASRLDMNRLPYDRGVLLALALDGALGQCSSYESSIRDWIQGLLQEKGTQYGPERLRAVFEEVAGTECAPGKRIWRRHVERGRPLEPSSLFERVGLHYLEAPTVDETEVLPLEGDRRAFETLFDRTRKHTTHRPARP